MSSSIVFYTLVEYSGLRVERTMYIVMSIGEENCNGTCDNYAYLDDSRLCYCNALLYGALSEAPETSTVQDKTDKLIITIP